MAGALKTYRIFVDVQVRDDHPDDPTNEENVVYFAYKEAKTQFSDGTADWGAIEQVGLYEEVGEG